MNKRHPIDDLFKQQLGQSSAEVPNDMWDKIAAERGKQDRKPKLFWLWSSLGVLLVVGGLLFATALFEPSPQPSEVTQKNIDQTAHTFTENQSEQANTAVLNEKETASTSSSVDQTIHHSSTINTSERAIKENRRINKYDRTSLTSKAETERRKITEQTTQTLTEDGTPVVASTTEQLNDENIKSLEEETRISGPHQRMNHTVVKTIPNISFDLLANQKVDLFKKSSTSCARFNSPFFHLDLEVLLGPAYAQQQLTARASESDSHLTQRLKSESANLSYSAGIRLAATSAVGLGLKTGLIYSEINDIFEHEVGSETNINIVYDPNGQVISMDTTFVGAYKEQHKNQLKFLEIPLLVGYETKVGKFRLGINAGAYLQVMFDAKGKIFSPATEEPIAFGQVGDSNVLPIFNQHASAAWYAGASIAYNLHSRYSILAEPYFKTFPRALSAPDYDLKQNYWTVGLQLGLRVRL